MYAAAASDDAYGRFPSAFYRSYEEYAAACQGLCVLLFDLGSDASSFNTIATNPSIR